MRFKVFTAFKRIQDSLKASFSNSAISLFAIIICTGTIVHGASSPSQPSQLTVSSDPIAGTLATPTLGGANLVGYWKFDEGTGPFAVDSSGHGNTGTLANGPTWTAGMSGNALRFDGIDDNVTVFDSNVLDLSNSFTISAWVNPSSTFTDFRAVLAKNYKYYLYASGAGFCGDGNPLGGFYEGGDTVSCEPRPLPVNTWSHLTVTYDGSTLTFYRNGLVGATAAVSGMLSPSTGTLQIGASEYGEYFQGLIDEVRVYNKRLSNAEIQSIYQQGAVNLPFDYAVTNSGNQSTYAGSSVTNTIVSTLSSGLSQPVSFGVSGLPAGASGSLSFTSCTLNCSTVLNISTGSSTPPGSYLITVTADGGGVKRTTVFTLSVALAVTVATPTTPTVGTSSGSVSGATQPATSGGAIIGTGKIYYVATDGNDTYSCSQAQTQSTPKRTLNAAFLCMASGDTVQVKGGTYATPTAMPPSGTSWNNPTTIKRLGSDIVTISVTTTGISFTNRSYIVWDGININGNGTAEQGIWLGTNTHHIRIINSVIYNTAAFGVQDSPGNASAGSYEIVNNKFYEIGSKFTHHGIYFGTPNNIIEGNDFFAIAGGCVHLYTGDSQFKTDYTIIRFNWCHDTGGRNKSSTQNAGLIAWDGSHRQIYGNIISNLDGVGMNIRGSNDKIYNNTSYSNKGFAISLEGSGHTVKNNIFWLNCVGDQTCAGWPYPVFGPGDRSSGSTKSNNLCDRPETGCTIISNPLFVAPEANNFRLQSGSPAIDKGANLLSENISYDLDGVARFRGNGFDIGAFESR